MVRYAVEFAGVVLASTAYASPFSSYHVGNSLTADMFAGNQLTDGWSNSKTLIGCHVKSGAPLTHVWNDPSTTDYLRLGTFTECLPNYTWDAVSVQPYRASNPSDSTLAMDAVAIRNFISLTRSGPGNGATVVYIYAAWPSISLASPDTTQYATQWLRSSTEGDLAVTMQARAYFLNLYDVLRQSEPAIKIIPAGEVVYELDLRMQQGEIAGFSGVSQLYRDDYHMNDLGREVAWYTAYASMHGVSPVGLNYGGATPISSDALRLVQETVWDVVSAHDYTMVPEPASVVVIAACGVGAFLTRRRKAVE